MEESPTVSDGTARTEGHDEPRSNETRDAASDGAAFARTGTALTALGRALRYDLSIASRLAAKKLRAAGSGALLRIRDIDLQAAKTGAAEAAARSAAVWSRVKLWHLRSADKRAVGEKQFRWRALGLLSAATAGACLVFIVILFSWALSDVPWEEIAEGSLKPVVLLETVDGKPLVRQGPIQGPFAAREKFPRHLIDAVLTSEDRRFYDHSGIDLKGILRASFRNVRAGEVVQGGSTITQQLIKILYLEQDRTWKRKIQEAVIAFWLERKLGKDEILTRYLNNIYLGAGATGVPAASRIYFDKEVRDLTLGESAMLAGIIRAPSQLNPIRNPEGARRQASLVLDAMVKRGKSTADQAKVATAKFAELHPTKPAARSGGWYSDWVMQEARELAGPYRGTIKIRTTMVPRLQVIAEKVVAEALKQEGAAAGASQAALIAMTPEGAVVAMVGGSDYAKSPFNRATTAMRQPGSAFKLFVYYAALKAGLTPGDWIEDAPIELNGWSPENYGGGYRGRVTIAEAFARSLNAATVALAMEIGIDQVIAAARELGIDAKLAQTPSLALGSSEVNLLDLTSAYASIRAGIAPVEPWGVVSFHADGQRAFRVGPPKQPTADIRQYQPDMVALLRLVVERGTGREADLGALSAGKTGTSQNHRDAWFVGFTEPLIVGVWVGNDDEAPMNEVTGGRLPARIWRNFMRAAAAEPADSARDSATNVTVDGSSADGAEAAATCNFRACASAYRSFRPADCTFQPYRGPRRFCEK